MRALYPTPEDRVLCYACRRLTAGGPCWLCPFHRRLYTFRPDGGMAVRQLGQPCIFRVKTEEDYQWLKNRT